MIREVAIVLASVAVAQASAMTDVQLHDILQRLHGDRAAGCVAAAIIDAATGRGPRHDAAAAFAQGQRAATTLALQLTTAQLAGYAGEYLLFGRFAITISVREAQLHAQGAGQTVRELQAVALDIFVDEPVEAEFHFERNAAGEVVAMTLLQTGLRFRGERH